MTIDRTLLNSLRHSSLGMQWLQGLARAGVRRSDGLTSTELYATAQKVHELDDSIAETYVGEQLFFPLPAGWWIWVPLLYAGGFMWALDRRGGVEERVSVFMVFCVVLAVVAAMVLTVKYVKERDARRERARQRPILTADRNAVRTELVRLRDRFLETHERH